MDNTYSEGQSIMKIICTNPKEQFDRYEGNINSAISDVCNSGIYINGPQVKSLEEEFAQYNGSKYCLGVSSGTSALELVLRAQNFEPNDEVITVSHTAIATVSAIKLANLTPVLIDVDKSSFNMCPDELINAITPQTKAVIVVHLYGQAADMDKIKLICDQNNLVLIEDCSQAHGAKWRNKNVGNFGIAGCFSCYPTKNLGAIGDAGLICTNDENLYNSILLMREYGWNEDRLSVTRGGNFRLDEMQAAILRVKLAALETMNNERSEVAELYRSFLPDYCELPFLQANASHVYHLFVIKVKNRSEVIKHMNSFNLFPGIHYILPVHKQPTFNNIRAHSMINTELLSSDILSLPMYPELGIKRAKHVSDVLQDLSV